jgi:uncharacterized cupin superfamily protein
MQREARLERKEHGLAPTTEGWFVVNVRDAAWIEFERFGAFCGIEGDPLFPQTGVHVHVVRPGQCAWLYHRETFQEDFLVLDGECTLIVEEEERHLSQWDFVHCPPGTDHVFVGRGECPCAILMIGNRVGPETLTYPVSEAAGAYGASVSKETTDPHEAYAGTPEPRAIPVPWPPAPGGES